MPSTADTARPGYKCRRARALAVPGALGMTGRVRRRFQSRNFTSLARNSRQSGIGAGSRAGVGDISTRNGVERAHSAPLCEERLWKRKTATEGEPDWPQVAQPRWRAPHWWLRRRRCPHCESWVIILPVTRSHLVRHVSHLAVAPLRSTMTALTASLNEEVPPLNVHPNRYRREVKPARGCQSGQTP